MKQPVKQKLLAEIGIVLGEHVQRDAEPPQPAPGDRAIHETRKAGRRPVGFRLACRTRSGSLVNDHQRTTERHTPQPARVSLAKPRGFLEVPLSELWLDLRLRNRRNGEQQQRD
jgi:hypothetical protein